MDNTLLKPVTKPSTSPTAEERLAEITQEIKQNQKNCDYAFLQIGLLLWEAKACHGPHGHWKQWLEENVDMPICKAQRLMRVAKRFSKNAPELSLGFTKLHILAAIPKDQYEQFISTVSSAEDFLEVVSRMGKRELQEKVDAFHGKKKVSSPKAAADTVATRVNALKTCADDLFAVINSDEACLDTCLPEVSDLCKVCKDILAKLDANSLEP